MDQKFCLTVLLLCALWYIVGSSCSVINKIFLQSYNYPFTIAMAQLLSISLYSIPLTRHLIVAPAKGIRPISLSYRFRFLLPMSLGKAFAVTFSQLSLSKVPVSYSHTVKATMPLFAVCTARLVLGERQTWRVYLSLIPICIGVIIASVTEISFDMAGLLSALASTFTYSILNTLAKRVYRDTNMHPMTLLRDMAQIAALMLFPVWCLTDAISLYNRLAKEPSAEEPLSYYFLELLLLSGALSFLQNVFAFTLIRKLSALSYAVANTTKRIVVITFSLLTLHNPVTVANVCGMLLAIFGVFGYNRTKSTAKRSSESDAEDLLPRVMTRATLSDASFLTSYPTADRLLSSSSSKDNSSNGDLLNNNHLSGGSPYRRVILDDSGLNHHHHNGGTGSGQTAAFELGPVVMDVTASLSSTNAGGGGKSSQSTTTTSQRRFVSFAGDRNTVYDV